MTIEENLAALRERISAAESRAGVAQGTVRLVGVTKTRTLEEIETAIRAGLTDIGENRLQDAQAKLPQLVLPVTKHFIGHLQRNKVPGVLDLFDLVQSVDSERLARAVDERAKAVDRKARILMEVNASGEASKFGVEPERAGELLGVIAGCRNIGLLGLMTIGLFSNDSAAVAESFRRLPRLYEKFTTFGADNCRMEMLSMGMSADFEIAIAEGANMVRVGTAIFGPRNS